jgi:alcohol dehydrogenase/L-iditol 2-dehydrogenase
MKALVKLGLGEDSIEVQDVLVPELTPGHVLIATKAVGICGSDVHMWRNSHSWEIAVPVIMGHESAGVIASLGEGVEGWTVGERVTIETAAYICGDCSLCRTGRYNLCPYREGFGNLRDGAFGEFIVVPTRVLHRIPDGVTFEEAAMTEPFAVAYNALVERATVTPGDLVVIQGFGAIGALSLQVARLRGASTIVVLGTDRDASRLRGALELGADHVVNVQREDAATLVAELHDGFGADVVVDATGVSAALRQSLELVRPLGSIVKIGWGAQPLDFSLDPLVQKAATLYGSFSHSWNTWERVLALFAAGRLDARGVLGGIYPIEEWEIAFEAMESGQNIKSVIAMDPSILG